MTESLQQHDRSRDQQTGQFDWLVTKFATETRGRPTRSWSRPTACPWPPASCCPADRAEQVAAVSSGLASLASGAARLFEGGAVLQTVIEMENGYLLLMSVGDGSHLAVLTRPPPTSARWATRWPSSSTASARWCRPRPGRPEA